jgi:DMSO/TMAO reductase YedYZ molybdopterin-dependent catalytic subunit
MAEAGAKRDRGLHPGKMLISGIGLLVVIIAVLSFLNRGQTGLQEGTVVVTAGGATLGSFAIDDLRKLPAVEKKMRINSTRGDTDNEFTCTPLLGVLNSIDPSLTRKYERIVTRGADNYTSGVYMSEVLQPDNVYIAYADHGKPLQTRTGEDGSLRIIVCNDQYGQRFTMWLVSLELQ